MKWEGEESGTDASLFRLSWDLKVSGRGDVESYLKLVQYRVRLCEFRLLAPSDRRRRGDRVGSRNLGQTFLDNPMVGCRIC